MSKDRKSYRISQHAVDRVLLRHNLDFAEAIWFMRLDLMESRRCTQHQASTFLSSSIAFHRDSEYRIGKYGVYAIREGLVCTYLLSNTYGNSLPLEGLLNANTVAAS